METNLFFKLLCKLLKNGNKYKFYLIFLKSFFFLFLIKKKFNVNYFTDYIIFLDYLININLFVNVSNKFDKKIKNFFNIFYLFLRKQNLRRIYCRLLMVLVDIFFFYYFNFFSVLKKKINKFKRFKTKKLKKSNFLGFIDC